MPYQAAIHHTEPYKMIKKFFPALIIIAGILLSQLFFSLMVYQSNVHLHRNILLAIDAGYLPVPNAHILPSLLQVGTAMKGAVFYTITVGIILPALVYLAAWAWDRGYRRKRPFLIMLSGLVIFCMVMLNRHGFNPVVTLWFLTVYIAVFKLTLYSLENVKTHLSPKRLLTHVIVIALLGGGWMTTMKDSNFFLSVRDHLLLSNAFGQRITDFYYRYTPYPTEAYKSLMQKNLKTCRIEGDVEADALQKIQNRLLHYDCLPIDTEEKTDFEIHAHEGALSFFVDDRLVLKTDIEHFLQTSDKKGQDIYIGAYQSLKRMSQKSDRNEFTKKLIKFSLYLLPAFLYAALFAFFQLAFGFITKPSVTFAASAGACLVFGIGALFFFKSIVPASVPVSQIPSALASDDADIRIAALQTISSKGLDLSAYMPDAFSNIPSHISERVWWTKCLANSQDQKAIETLLQLLDDPHPLVACKAFESLGQRKKYRPAAKDIIKKTILERIKTSRHWYVQVYAYRALGVLKWTQNISN
jgi:Ca2+/Na+ antiporter